MTLKHSSKLIMHNAKRHSKITILMPVVILLVLTGGIAIGVLHYYGAESYLVLQGDEQITVGKFGIYEDPGVVAMKNGRDVTDKVEIIGEPDLKVPGDYTIRYQSDNFVVQRTVTVLDHMVPKLKLKGEKHQTLLLGDGYEDPGFKAKGEDGTPLTDQVERTIMRMDEQTREEEGRIHAVEETDDGQMDFRRAGEFEITYKVSDDQGHTTVRTRSVTVEPNTEYGSVGLPICMYHYVYDENDPPADVNARYKNYISQQDLTEEMNWLNEEGYYYPTWEEVRDYVDGNLLLPDKSIVLTFDDGEQYTLEHLAPVVEETHVPVTSFLITVHNGEEKVKDFSSKYLQFQSHTHDLHRAGGVAGYRGILPVIDYETGLADLQKSIEICGSHDAIAYPYGDNSANSHAMVEAAGFLCGVTIEWGKAYPGMDPLVLPRIRMWQDQTMDYFMTNVAPSETAAEAGTDADAATDADAETAPETGTDTETDTDAAP